MSILGGAVGDGSKNQADDVKTVQLLLNLNIGRLMPMTAVPVTGKSGPATVALINEFQKRVMKARNPDGVIDPGGATLGELRNGLPADVSADMLFGVFVHSNRDRVAKFAGGLIAALTTTEIDSDLRRAHFLAQIGHESGELVFTEEIASGAAYEGRADLGNTVKGDGQRFKGRGLIQITGRANYAAYGKDRGADYLSDGRRELLATDPATAVDCSVWFWKKAKCNVAADKDNVEKVTRIVNGGLNGIDNRTRLLARAKFFLKPQ